MISFVIHGPPVSAARPRLSRGRTFDPKSAERKKVEAFIREELILQNWELTENLVGVHFEFYLQHYPNTPNTCLLYTSPSPRD